MLTSGPFVFRPFTDADAPAIAQAGRESGATVGEWMSWAHDNYTESEALSWFSLPANLGELADTVSRRRLAFKQSKL